MDKLRSGVLALTSDDGRRYHVRCWWFKNISVRSANKAIFMSDSVSTDARGGLASEITKTRAHRRPRSPNIARFTRRHAKIARKKMMMLTATRARGSVWGLYSAAFRTRGR